VVHNNFIATAYKENVSLLNGITHFVVKHFFATDIIGNYNNEIENDVTQQIEISKRIKYAYATTWAYITAYNPYSKSLSKDESFKRHEQLKQKVNGYTFFEGAGVGEDTNWEPETSLLVIGILKKESIEIGKYFEQNAILVGEIYGLPEL